MRNLVVVGMFLALATVLTACVDVGLGPGDASPEVVVVTTAPTATPLPSTDFSALTVVGAEGLTLWASFYPPASASAPGVLLLHSWGRERGEWASFATRLQENGYAVLALDLRGHGESEGEAGGETPSAVWVEDALQAWEVLAAQAQVDPERTAIVGADIGANLALAAAAAESRVRAVALLSPLQDDQGIPTGEALSAYGERPVLIVASQNDPSAAQVARRLSDLAQGPATVTLYPDAGHGTAMFGPQPDLHVLILAWLGRQLAP
jgi:pimeloyl-ACP methyl ester carboxylesterase